MASTGFPSLVSSEINNVIVMAEDDRAVISLKEDEKPKPSVLSISLRSAKLYSEKWIID